MLRSNHYEAAFESYLRQTEVEFISVNESKRGRVAGEEIKSVDFVVVGPHSARLIVDVKGRKFPSGSHSRPSMVWQNWVEQDDIDGLGRWAEHFGSSYRGVFAFVYLIAPPFTLPVETLDLFRFRERTYLMRAVSVSEYRERMRIRSRRWNTVFVRSASFRDIVKPFSAFLNMEQKEVMVPEISPLKKTESSP